MSARSEEARRLLSNPISRRLADGWYPSGRNGDGEVQHDRHVLIWVRNYERLLDQLADEIEQSERDLSEGSDR